jgi:TP901 family phage tail tape measure protein
MAELTSALVIQLIDQVTATAEKVTAALNKMGTAAQTIGGPAAVQHTSAFATQLGRVQSAFVGMQEAQQNLLGAIGSYYILKEAIKEPVAAAREFEGALVDLQKRLGLIGGTVTMRGIRDEIVGISQQLGIAEPELAKMYATLYSGGVPLERIKDMTVQFGKWAIALNVPAGELASQLLEVKHAANLSDQELTSLVNTTTLLHNKTGVAAADLIEIVRTVGAFNKIAGLSTDETAALGAAFERTGLSTGQATTTMSYLTKVLTAGSGATKDQKKYLEELGFSAEGLAASMQKDAIGTIQDFIGHLAQMQNKELLATALTHLFGAGVRGASKSIADSIGNFQLFTETLDQLQNPARASAAQDAFAKQIATSGFAIDKFMNSVKDLTAALGSGLVKVLGQASGALGPLIDAATRLVEKFPEATGILLGVAASFVVLSIGASLANYAFRGAVLAFEALKLALLPIQLALTGLAWLMGTTVLAVGALVGVVVFAAVAIYRSWDKLSKDLKEIFTGNPFLGLHHFIYDLGQAFANLALDVLNYANDIFKGLTGIDLSSVIRAFVAMAGKFVDVGIAWGKAIVTGILQGIADAAVSLAQAAKDAIMNPGGVHAVPNMPQTGGVHLLPNGTFGALPGRAAGGPVYAGQSYMVGEKGAETFVPDVSGRIFPKGHVTGASVMADLIKLGWTKDEAAAAAGVAMGESTMRPGVVNSVGATGLFQMLSSDRKGGMLRFAAATNRKWDDPHMQAEWYNLERTGGSVKYGGSDERANFRRALRGGEAGQMSANLEALVQRPGGGIAQGMGPGLASSARAWRDAYKEGDVGPNIADYSHGAGKSHAFASIGGPGGVGGRGGRAGGGSGLAGGVTAGGGEGGPSTMHTSVEGVSLTLNFYGDFGNPEDIANTVRGSLNQYVTDTFQGVYSDTGLRFT